MQVVVDLAKFDEELLRKVTTGACLRVDGRLVASCGAGQGVEVQAEKIEIYGTADPETYPLQKKGHSLEFLRDIAYLRPRTNTFGAIFRIRHAMAMRYINILTTKVLLPAYAADHRFGLRSAGRCSR